MLGELRQVDGVLHRDDLKLDQVQRDLANFGCAATRSPCAGWHPCTSIPVAFGSLAAQLRRRTHARRCRAIRELRSISGAILLLPARMSRIEILSRLRASSRCGTSGAHAGGDDGGDALSPTVTRRCEHARGWNERRLHGRRSPEAVQQPGERRASAPTARSTSPTSTTARFASSTRTATRRRHREDRLRAAVRARVRRRHALRRRPTATRRQRRRER